jgi:hypothetical protein
VLFRRVAVSAALLALAILPLRMAANPRLGVYEKQHQPYADLAREIRKDGFRLGQIVLGEDRVIAGNLKIHLDAAVASSPDIDIVTPLAEAGRLDLSACDQTLVAWHGGDGAMPEAMARWLATLGVDWRGREVRHLSMPYKHARGGAAYHLHYIIAGTTPLASAGDRP